MNKIEKIVYDLVKKNPRIKYFIRNVYQTFFDLLPDKENFVKGNLILKEGYFFGFHDISPFSIDEKRILSNRLEIGLHMPEKSDPLTVGYWENSLNTFHEIAKTYAWNYHKGCRLQWLGRSNTQVIYNSINGEKLGATIYDIEKDIFKYIDYPIDTVDFSGRFASSFSYERLQKYMPGYGYCCNDEPFFEEYESSNTGLFLIDLENNVRKIVVSLYMLAHYKEEESMKGARHYVTHSEFSPEGDRIAFLHRWIHGDTEKRWTRLVTCKLDGTEVYVSPTSGMVSHYDWDEKHGILAYCQIDGQDGHYLFMDHKMEQYQRVAKKINSDGHQSYIPNSDYFVTDTYPDKRRYAKLYLVDLNSDEETLIADLKSPKKYQSPNENKHWACDLHPRVSPSGNFLSFDSVHNNERSFCVMDISDIKI